VILEAEAHIYHYELGGLSAIAGVLPRLVNGEMVFQRLKMSKRLFALWSYLP